MIFSTNRLLEFDVLTLFKMVSCQLWAWSFRKFLSRNIQPGIYKLLQILIWDLIYFLLNISNFQTYQLSLQINLVVIVYCVSSTRVNLWQKQKSLKRWQKPLYCFKSFFRTSMLQVWLLLCLLRFSKISKICLK